MFDDIFNNDNNNENQNGFNSFYFGKWFIDPNKLFKGSMNDSRNSYGWLFNTKKPRIENVCVATLKEDEQEWYNDLLARQNELSGRIANLQRQLERAQHEQAILDIDNAEFNSVIRDRHNLSLDIYPELLVGTDGKHIYQQVDLSKSNQNTEE